MRLRGGLPEATIFIIFRMDWNWLRSRFTSAGVVPGWLPADKLLCAYRAAHVIELQR